MELQQSDPFGNMKSGSEETPSIIKIFGVGGAGCNAVDLMYKTGIKGVNYVNCNTDKQALDRSPVKKQIQLGKTQTCGLGAGCDPEAGKNAAIESLPEIEAVLKAGTKMVIIAAGMGGGTGTGAAPVIAEAAHNLGILTIAVVTIPYKVEGRQKLSVAIEGIDAMQKYVDSILVLNTDKLRDLYGNMKVSEGLGKANELTCIATKGIAEMISVDMTCNVDFADIKKATLQSGCAVMGVGVAKGENRALEAVKQAVTSPLLNNNDIYGARSIIVSVLSDPEDEVTIDEQGVIMDFLADMAGGEENDEYWMKWGEGTDENLTDGEVRVTVIATGYANDCFMTRKAGTAIKIARNPNGENVVIDGAADANEGDVAPMTEEEKQQLEAKKRKAAEVNKKIDILYGNENQTETFTRFDYSKLSEPRTVALKDMTEEVLSNIENTTAYARRTASVN